MSEESLKDELESLTKSLNEKAAEVKRLEDEVHVANELSRGFQNTL